MSTPFQTPHLFARKIALNPLRSTSNDGPTKPVLKTKKMHKCRNYIFCFHIFTQVHTTNPAHATRGRGHLVAALSFFVTSSLRWLDLQHTHARTCHLKPRRVHHAPAPPPQNRLQPILSFSLGLVLFCTCPKVSHTHTVSKLYHRQQLLKSPDAGLVRSGKTNLPV